MFQDRRPGETLSKIEGQDQHKKGQTAALSLRRSQNTCDFFHQRGTPTLHFFLVPLVGPVDPLRCPLLVKFLTSKPQASGEAPYRNTGKQGH